MEDNNINHNIKNPGGQEGVIGRNLQGVAAYPPPLNPPLPPPSPYPAPPPMYPPPPYPPPPALPVAAVIVSYRIQGLIGARRRQLLQTAPSLGASQVMTNIASGAAGGTSSALFQLLRTLGLNISSLELIGQSVSGGVPSPPTPPPLAPPTSPSPSGISRLTEIFIYVGVSVACGESAYNHCCP